VTINVQDGGGGVIFFVVFVLALTFSISTFKMSHMTFIEPNSKVVKHQLGPYN
jgi:hypothetical protein